MFEFRIGAVDAVGSHAAATGSCTVRVFQFTGWMANSVPGSLAAATVACTTAPAELAVDLVELPADSGVLILSSIVGADQGPRGFLSFQGDDLFPVEPVLAVEILEFEVDGLQCGQIGQLMEWPDCRKLSVGAHSALEIHFTFDDKVAVFCFRTMVFDPLALDLAVLFIFVVFEKILEPVRVALCFMS